ncbi:MAG: hypothetical protein GXP09_05860 [Gammaproteobacteria bacterium]|nr:hypothetical protein [Gammaproteobacteria bacterium]
MKKFAVMALPDARKCNLRTKTSVAIIPVARLINGMALFARAVHRNNENETYRLFNHDLMSLRDQIFECAEPLLEGPLIINTSNSKIAKEWRHYRTKKQGLFKIINISYTPSPLPSPSGRGS